MSNLKKCQVLETYLLFSSERCLLNLCNFAICLGLQWKQNYCKINKQTKKVFTSIRLRLAEGPPFFSFPVKWIIHLQIMHVEILGQKTPLKEHIGNTISALLRICSFLYLSNSSFSSSHFSYVFPWPERWNLSKALCSKGDRYLAWVRCLFRWRTLATLRQSYTCMVYKRRGKCTCCVGHQMLHERAFECLPWISIATATKTRELK